ncbi:MAG TPA: lysoplasmalogenase, partial [Acidimicrobiales bacterium]
MTTTAAVLLAAAGVLALVDWIGVLRHDRRLRVVGKPGTLALLVAVAVALHPQHSSVRTWIVIGLVCSLAGDIFLLLPDEERWFIAGLGSFFVGHVAYVVGLQLDRRSVALVGVGLVVVAVCIATIGRRVVAAVRVEHPELTGPVVAYLLVISLMVLSAFGTRNPWAIAGAATFYASDAILSWNRFVEERRWGEIGVMVTYHLAQAGLVLFL